MKMFLSRKKYRVIVVVTTVVTLFVLFYYVIPAARRDIEIFSIARSEIKMSETVQETESSPDSLIAEYKKVSARIQKYTNVRVTSSKILTFVHDVAGKSGITLNDLSTGEMRYSGNEMEIPVSFRTMAPFAEVLRFLKELENGAYCIRADEVNLNRDEKGLIVVSVRFSVLSRSASNSAKSSKDKGEKSSLNLKDMFALLKPQEIEIEKVRDPFRLPKQLLPKPKATPVKTTTSKTQLEPKQHQPVTLDAILPGKNPVAILKYNGESAVVSVGQKVWNVTIVAIKNDRVILSDEIGKFELKN